jgi:hypothetical protein
VIDYGLGRFIVEMTDAQLRIRRMVAAHDERMRLWRLTKRDGGAVPYPVGFVARPDDAYR